MPLGREVNLGPGDIVLDEVAAPPQMDTAPPVFGSCLLWPNSWMDEDTTWYGSRPRHIVSDGVPALHERGAAAPCFRPMSIVATVTRLSYCLALVADFCML